MTPLKDRIVIATEYKIPSLYSVGERIEQMIILTFSIITIFFVFLPFLTKI